MMTKIMGKSHGNMGTSSGDMKACILSFLNSIYGKYVEKIFSNWRWHDSASWGTGQIQIGWIDDAKTKMVMGTRRNPYL